MSEKFHTEHPANERRNTAMVAQESVDLHNQSAGIVIKGLKPLIPKDVALEQYGISGDVLATITLPSKHPSEPPKEIAFIDFGPDVSAENPTPVFVFKGRPVPMTGKATTRYGLGALNYVPQGHLATHVPVESGSLIKLGSEGNESHRLGLSGTEEIGNDLLAHEHVSIAFADGVLGIADHSTVGTRLTLAAEQHVSAVTTPDQLAASLALLGAGLKKP